VLFRSAQATADAGGWVEISRYDAEVVDTTAEVTEAEEALSRARAREVLARQ
jgi:hypothetical protein